MELKKLYKNTIKVSKNLKNSVANAAVENSEELSDLNREQLSVGLLSSGDSTYDYASIDYANFKSSIGSKSVPNMDFKLTGDFHKGIYVKKVGNEAIFDGKDSKTDILTLMYGDDLLGIAPNNAQKAANEIEPELFIDIEKQLEKGIL